MSGPARQLTLDWPHDPSYAREDFLEAPGNAEALRAILSWPDWPGRMLMLVGPSGSGKSHLGAIWARKAAARVVAAEALSHAPLVELAAANALLIEDADRVGAEEAALFHLLNLARESGAPLLLTARAQPDAWGLSTADLLSRLRLAPIVSIGAPDLDLTQAVLFKLFSDRQLMVDPSVVSYVALRIERSLDAARAIVAALDREALARGKAVTRAMAAELLRDEPPGD
ncbi:MAG TPA: DnaA/Hda family protein [Roseiarcus sp.]|nr:DnaA/Hda family protein [Roseiarcus sp.]